MAQAVTPTITGSSSQGDVQRISLDWQSASDGSVTYSLPVNLFGEIVRVSFVPDTGATQPTNLYDVTITDANSIDVLAGQGANLANNANTNVCPGVPLKDGTTTSVRPMVVAGALTLNITNAGDTKGGIIVLHLK